MTWVRLALLAASLWALRREFAGVDVGALLHRMAAYGWPRIAMGVAATAGSFLLLGGIELLALATTSDATRRIPKPLGMGTAFVAHAVSQSVGLAILTGAAVRMRAYERRGLDATQVAQMSTVVTLGISLGLLAAAAWAFLATSAPVVVAGHALAVRPIGLLLALTVVVYLAWAFAGAGRAASTSRWRIPRPSPRVAVGLNALATIDWAVTGGVLYAFIPGEAHIALWTFMRAYIIAQTVGVLSHVPAGAGVFEVVLLGLLTAASPTADRPALLAAILMYRALYYLLPLCVAVAFAGVTELRRSRRAPADRDMRGWHSSPEPEAAS